MASKKAASRARRKPSNQVRVRMYRHGLGDCFLLRLPKDGGKGTCNVLIDCGLISVAKEPKQTMARVLSDLAKETGSHLDIVVMTHEHWDHVSGFSSQQVQDAFARFRIDHVWYAWTEDPDNKLGKKLNKERAAKVAALHKAALALSARQDELAVMRSQRVLSVLQFFGVGSAADLGVAGAVGKTRAAFEYLGKRPGTKAHYCYPDKAPLRLPGVSSVRTFVLGPPQDEGMLKRSSPTKKGKEVYELAGEERGIENLECALERLGGVSTEYADCPFDAGLSVRGTRGSPVLGALKTHWDAPQDDWRKIDLDWTSACETLALDLDNHTNNTCLVLAFELIDSGQVLLFAADAQVGNWLSWQDTRWRVSDGTRSKAVRGPDLLARTVFYKVGHHGSHNATLRALGLEQMTSEDLVAFVPVFKEQAEKNRWHEMPFGPLVKRLREKTQGRLVFSDRAQKPPTTKQLASLRAADQERFVERLKVDPLFYEYAFDL